MEQDKFDDIAKAMAGGADRRSVLKRIAGGVLGGLFAVGAGQAEAAKKQCGKDGAKCHGTGHCCKGYYCYKKNGGPYGKCTKKAPTSPPPPPACKKYGEKCSSSSPCCTGKGLYCDTSNGYGKCKYQPTSPPPPPPPPACRPKTCNDYGNKCGKHKDGCGGYIYCTGCKSGYSCDRSQYVCKKTPTSPPPATCPKNSDACQSTPTCGTGCSCGKTVDGQTICRQTLSDCTVGRVECNYDKDCGPGRVCVNVDKCCKPSKKRGVCSTLCATKL